MKRTIFLTIAAFFVGTALHSQCIPDLTNCIDTDEPGQICPRYLPDAQVNVNYNEVITVVAPGNVVLGDDTVFIDYILIDSITNIPEGITYAANADKFYADSAYCVQISGTPIMAGEYPLAIYITPFVFYAGTTIPAPQAVNDTSVVMTVTNPSGIDPGQFTEFHLLPNKPNPFADITTVGFFTPFDDKVELQVYNIMGALVHEEKDGYPPGEYNFEFNGKNLAPGTYFYRVKNHNQFRTGKLIKSKR